MKLWQKKIKPDMKEYVELNILNNKYYICLSKLIISEIAQQEMTEYKNKGKPTLLQQQQQHQMLVQQQQQILAQQQQQQQQMMAVKDESDEDDDDEDDDE